MNFGLYFNLGIEHITDPMGYDHILFVVAMCAIYRLQQWRRLALMVTAFTVGHSIALALAVLEVVPVNPDWIEFLIPVTIFSTCILNISFPPSQNELYSRQLASSSYWHYFIILAFGLIHGLGFSNFLRASLTDQESLFVPLLAFNLGLEIGQLLIVFFLFLVNAFFLDLLRKQPRDWNFFVSGAVAGISFLMLIERAATLFADSASN